MSIKHWFFGGSDNWCKNRRRYLIFIGVSILILICFLAGWFGEAIISNQNIYYLLSSISQGLATVFVLIVTMKLLIVTSMLSSNDKKVDINRFTKMHPSEWVFYIFFIITIALPLWLLYKDCMYSFLVKLTLAFAIICLIGIINSAFSFIGIIRDGRKHHGKGGVVKSKKENTNVNLDSKKKIKSQKNNQINVPLIIALIALIPSLFGNFLQFQQNRNLVKDRDIAIQQYREQLIPEIDCEYNYYGMTDSVSLLIKNIGLIDIDNVWIEEFVYVVDSINVHLGTDVPHYNYAIYKGSRERMFDLDRGESKEIVLAEWQRYAFSELINKFHANVVTKWQITFSCDYSPKRYSFTKFFVYDSEFLMFKEISQYVGGHTILDRIRTYHSFGSKSEIKIFSVTHDFEINPPNAFLINREYTIEPLHIWRKIRLSEMVDAEYIQFFGELDFMPSYDICEGTVRYMWGKSNGYIVKSLLTVGLTKAYTPWIALPLAYLNEKDAQTFINNPDLLKTKLAIRMTRKPGELSSKFKRDDETEEIFRRAREKLHSGN